MTPLPDNNAVLIALLVKLGIAASLAALLSRSQKFRKTLFAEPRDYREKLHLFLFWGIPLALGVAIRYQMDYVAFDLTLEGTFVAGLLGGTVVGSVVGCLTGLTALFHKEWITFPISVIVGLTAGLLRNLCPSKEQVWSFSPFVPINFLLSLRSMANLQKFSWQLIFFFTLLGFDVMRYLLGQSFPKGWIFYLSSDNLAVLVTIFVATVGSAGLVIKIWNNTRLELKLAEQEVLVVKSRLDALANQINPHFLFNTLNSISSLIRTNPAKARHMVLKLSHILRKLLQGHENFIPLREELEFIDNYLDIEVIRFGKDKLRVEKEIESETLGCLIPSMILQPIIENSIKHGIAPKIDHGSIVIRSSRRNGKICIEVEDDGVGIPSESFPRIYHSGIGISNVVERLKVAYQSDYAFAVNSFPGKGTFTHIEIPIRESTAQTKVG
ncbi:MAG: histidine kinase [Acidobacteriota bacterium]